MVDTSVSIVRTRVYTSLTTHHIEYYVQSMQGMHRIQSYTPCLAKNISNGMYQIGYVVSHRTPYSNTQSDILACRQYASGRIASQPHYIPHILPVPPILSPETCGGQGTQCHTVPRCIYRAYPVHNCIFFLLRISSIPRTTGEPWTASAHSIVSHKIEHSPRFRRARYKTSLIYDGPFPMQGSAPYPGDVWQ